jgi:putative transposase
MTNYRRNRVPGDAFFVTVAIAERRLDLLVRHIVHLKAALRDEQQRAPFANFGLLVPQDHLHSAAHWLTVAMCHFLAHSRTDNE